MKLSIIGGGGFRVPIIVEALLRDAGALPMRQIALVDPDPERLTAIRAVLDQMNEQHGGLLNFTQHASADDALPGSDFVFSAIRVGGLEGRTRDERGGLSRGILGQETTGAGGISYALRSVPVALKLAESIKRHAPAAWTVNFSNPAGIVTQAMARVLGDRVIGICDSPSALCRRVAIAAGADPRTAGFDYVGLNHLGWVRAVFDQGRDVLPDLLADREQLESFEEGRLFGAEWIRAIGGVPNEYLHYYYHSRAAVDAILSEDRTRGEFLRDQQSAFYDSVADDPSAALATWRTARHERDATYMQETRTSGEQRTTQDVELGGYERVALAVMRGIHRDDRSVLILNVRNRGAIPGMDEDSVVEVPCVVDANGAHPLASEPLSPHMRLMIERMKLVETLAIDAALTGSYDSAWRAFAEHPLVGSPAIAAELAADAGFVR